MQRIDNPMASIDHSDDPQCKPLPYKCDMGNHRANNVTHFLNGDCICDDCKQEYLRVNAGEFVEQYIATHRQDYFVEWWFNGLSEKERLDIIRKAYALQEVFDNTQELPPEHTLAADRVEFCLEQDDFLNYVETCLT